MDDSTLLLKAHSKIIESCGFTVLSFTSAHSALQALGFYSTTSDNKDSNGGGDCVWMARLLLADIVMPECDGLTLLQTLRGDTSPPEGLRR